MQTKINKPLQDVSQEFLCPLTKELFVDPVVSRYGHSFERNAIMAWLEEGNDFCPVSGNPLRPSCLVSNKALEWKIRCWLHDHGKAAPEHEEPILSAAEHGIGVVAIVPEKYKCAITKGIMVDPVVCKRGQTFERSAILKYLEENSDKCPITGMALYPHDLVPHNSLKHEIHEWLEKNGDHGDELPKLGPIDDVHQRRDLSPTRSFGLHGSSFW